MIQQTNAQPYYKSKNYIPSNDTLPLQRQHQQPTMICDYFCPRNLDSTDALGCVAAGAGGPLLDAPAPGAAGGGAFAAVVLAPLLGTESNVSRESDCRPTL